VAEEVAAVRFVDDGRCAGAVVRPGWVLAARLHIDLLRVSTALCPTAAIAA